MWREGLLLVVLVALLRGISGRKVDDSDCEPSGETQCISVSYGVTENQPPGPPGSNGLPMTDPSTRVTFATATSEMPGWDDIPASKLFFSGIFIGLQLTIPSYTVNPNTPIEFSCSSAYLDGVGSQYQACDLFFFMYRCGACTVSLGSHRIGHTLLQEDWHRIGCSAHFRLHERGRKHHLIAWHKEIAKHDKIVVNVVGFVVADFLMWGIVAKTNLCSVKNKIQCEAADDDCTWDEVGQACHSDVCFKPLWMREWNYGPFGEEHAECDVCVDEEGAHIPELQNPPPPAPTPHPPAAD